MKVLHIFLGSAIVVGASHAVNEIDPTMAAKIIEFASSIIMALVGLISLFHPRNKPPEK